MGGGARARAQTRTGPTVRVFNLHALTDPALLRLHQASGAAVVAPRHGQATPPHRLRHPCEQRTSPLARPQASRRRGRPLVARRPLSAAGTPAARRAAHCTCSGTCSGTCMQCARSVHAVQAHAGVISVASIKRAQCPCTAPCHAPLPSPPLPWPRAEPPSAEGLPITSTSTSLGVLPMAASWACSPYNRSNAVSFLLGFFHHQLRSSLLLAASMGAGRRSISPEVVGCCLRALASMRAKKLGSSPVSDTEFIVTRVCGRRPTAGGPTRSAVLARSCARKSVSGGNLRGRSSTMRGPQLGTI